LGVGRQVVAVPLSRPGMHACRHSGKGTAAQGCTEPPPPPPHTHTYTHSSAASATHIMRVDGDL
jgi:hypothetical protein